MSSVSFLCSQETKVLKINKGANIIVVNIACNIFYCESGVLHWKENIKKFIFLPMFTKTCSLNLNVKGKQYEPT